MFPFYFPKEKTLHVFQDFLRLHPQIQTVNNNIWRPREKPSFRPWRRYVSFISTVTRLFVRETSSSGKPGRSVTEALLINIYWLIVYTNESVSLLYKLHVFQDDTVNQILINCVIDIDI